MKIKWRNFGFGAFLEEGEDVVYIFHPLLVIAFSKMCTRLALWGSGAFLVWFLFPTKLFYVWTGLAGFAIYRGISALIYWYINAILITNDGIIFVNWPSLFVKKFRRIDWFNLDQVAVEKVGIKAFAGNFGSLMFMKMGGDIEEVKYMRRPHKVARMIERHRAKMSDDKNFTEESALKELLSQLVMSHVDKNGQPERKTPEELTKKEDINQNKIIPPESDPKPQKQNAPEKIKKEFSHEVIITEEMDITVEKELDDTGGFDIDFFKTNPPENEKKD